MANQKISTLPPANVLDGTELVELVQGGVNVKGALNQLNLVTITKYLKITPAAAGTLTDNVLPDAFDYILDYDTTVGPIELDGFVAQRDGQRVTITNVGGHSLKVGSGVGAPGNQVRSS